MISPSFEKNRWEKKAQHPQWALNKMKKNFQWDLYRVKEYALEAQKLFCLKFSIKGYKNGSEWFG